jgi:thimet oligopeptidase
VKLGRIYLDMHPRPNKYKHAAQFSLQKGVEGKQLPEGVLVCNFADPKTSDGPALMEHDQVVVMFHEFGHLVHHIMSGHGKWAYFSGGSYEWDFIEAPSQMLEEWAWDPATLQSFALNVQTREPISVELAQKAKDANEFGKGFGARTQMFYAAMSLQFHEANPDTLDFLKKQVELQKKYALWPYMEGTHMYAGFGHLNGYSATYYTYMWSLVIAKDLFSEFQKHGLFDVDTATRYRDKVLKPGGSKDAADLIKDFLGRPFNFDAYEKWMNKG